MNKTDLSNLDIKQFESWLRNQPGNTIVATEGARINTPLTAYLKERTGTTYVIGTDGFALEEDAKPIAPLPDWAYRFLLYFDALLLARTTAKVALQVLDRVRRPKLAAA